jgi:hypothetical protein
MFRFFLFLAFVPALARADLGDTMEESALKYGPASATGSPQILTYVYNQMCVWQIYDDTGHCIVAEFRLVNNGPFPAAQCAALDRANLPAGLVLGEGSGWDITNWPDNATNRDTLSWQYTGEDGTTLFQVISGQSRSANIGRYFYRVYLSGVGIEAINALQGAANSHETNHPYASPGNGSDRASHWGASQISQGAQSDTRADAVTNDNLQAAQRSGSRDV